MVSFKFFRSCCLCISLLFSINLWSQSETQNSEKAQALQQQLDAMRAQMESIQAQILELTGGTKTTVTATSPGVPADENPAVQAAALNLVPRQKVPQATATYVTDSQDQVAAPRIDNAPFDPRFPG